MNIAFLAGIITYQIIVKRTCLTNALYMLL